MNAKTLLAMIPVIGLGIGSISTASAQDVPPKPIIDQPQNHNEGPPDGPAPEDSPSHNQEKLGPPPPHGFGPPPPHEDCCPPHHHHHGEPPYHSPKPPPPPKENPSK